MADNTWDPEYVAQVSQKTAKRIRDGFEKPRRCCQCPSLKEGGTPAVAAIQLWVFQEGSAKASSQWLCERHLDMAERGCWEGDLGMSREDLVGALQALIAVERFVDRKLEAHVAALLRGKQ